MRVASNWKQRPTAALTRDPFFGNRCPITGKPIREAEAWTEQDFSIANAYQLLQDLTNQHGLLAYEVDNERMDVIANRKTDKFAAARDRATASKGSKGYQAKPGEYFEPELVLRGGKWPTLAEYWESLQAKEESEDDD